MIDRIASWNVRGAHIKTKQQEIKRLIEEHSIGILAVLETKLDIDQTQHLAQYINPNWNYADNLQQSPYGRIFLIWNPTRFHINILLCDSQLIHTHITHPHSNIAFLCTFIYAYNSQSERQKMHDIIPSLQTVSMPWFCIGDYNCMHKTTQKSGGNILSITQIAPLNHTITSSSLFELQYTGLDFTWNNKKREGPRTYCKLDHIFSNLQALQQWPTISYHIPPLAYLTIHQLSYVYRQPRKKEGHILIF